MKVHTHTPNSIPIPDPSVERRGDCHASFPSALSSPGPFESPLDLLQSLAHPSPLPLLDVPGQIEPHRREMPQCQQGNGHYLQLLVAFPKGMSRDKERA